MRQESDSEIETEAVVSVDFEKKNALKTNQWINAFKGKESC